MSNNKHYEILDCTIRDGGYVNNWAFDEKVVRETYRALSKAGLDYVELGYHGTVKHFDVNKYGKFRFSDIKTIARICDGIAGAAVSLMVDFGKFEVNALEQYRNSPVKLIRLAFHKDKIIEALKSALSIKEKGFKVSINLMGFSSYSNDERQQLISLLKDSPIDYVYIADTYGSMFPHQIEGFFRPLLELKHIRWGFHPHNNLQMAFANSLAAVEAGAQVIDSSVYGMGRGAGNLPTEILLAYLQLANPERYNVIPVLSLVDHYFEKLKQEYGWGYDLPYMLSGIYGCHPDYAKNLVDRKEYNIEEIWNILGIVRNYDPIGYKKPLVDDILKKGVFGRKYTSLGNNQSVILNSGFRRKVNYIDRHSGRGFLVIANGPSLPKHVEAISQFIDKYQPIVMAGNYIGDLFKPDYHAFNNKRRFVDYVGLVAKESALLIGEYISDEMIIEYTDRDFERMYYEDVQDAPFDINEGVISSNCRTIALLLMGTAIIMGAERIFAVGLDGYLNQQDGEFLHFYNEKDESTDSATLMDKHLGNLKFLDEIDQYLIRHGKEGVHILTPTNYTKFYKGIENYL